jgi:hypothetical protein
MELDDAMLLECMALPDMELPDMAVPVLVQLWFALIALWLLIAPLFDMVLPLDIVLPDEDMELPDDVELFCAVAVPAISNRAAADAIIRRDMETSGDALSQVRKAAPAGEQKSPAPVRLLYARGSP